MEKKHYNNNIVNTLSSDFQPPMLPSGPGETSNSSPAPCHNPRKKQRTKFMRNTTVSNPKPTHKPDPSAPKITRPCTECGRKFWSWKALFGHMRCHPNRPWRGIIPPPNFRRAPTEDDDDEEDREVAACLLMLANGPPALVNVTPEYSDYSDHHQRINDNNNKNMLQVMVVDLNKESCGRFECSSCKKVFGSHQALGGHRASHKNVKGCYAITKNEGEVLGGGGDGGTTNCCSSGGDYDHDQMMMLKDTTASSSSYGHKCNICFRVFSTGQALGGHMRCHWEKLQQQDELQQPILISTARVFSFDLNHHLQEDDIIAPHVQDEDDASSPYSSSSSSALDLDLRLGLSRTTE